MAVSPTITLHNASLRLGSRQLWRRMQLQVQPGECIAVLGPNGAGKSSFIKTLLGMHTLDSGSVQVMGKSPRQARNKIGYIPQQATFDRDIPLTGRELIKLGLTGHQWLLRPMGSAASARIEAVLSEVGAQKFADKPLGMLSGGEQQRLRIAQALVTEPQVLLCDEPLLSLDITSQQAVAELIAAQRQKGTSVLFVTHEINPVLPLIDRVLYIVGGKWAIGTPKEILTSQRLSELYGAPVDVLQLHGRIIVISATEQTATEPNATHHHHHEGQL